MKESEVYLRKATMEDKDLLFEWANDPIVRSNAFSTKSIGYEEHCEWFEHVLTDDEELQFILSDGYEAIGQVRLTISGDIAEIDYSVAPNRRGMGYGSILIYLIKKKVNEEYPNVKKLVAKVKPKNVASILCFEDNQFIEKYKQYEYEMACYKTENNDNDLLTQHYKKVGGE